MTGKLKILHLDNTSGIASLLREGQRRAGLDSRILQTWDCSMYCPHDYENYYHGRSVRTVFEMLKTADVAKEFDIVHVHSGISGGRLDVLAIKLLELMPMVVHYHGQDTRRRYAMRYRSLANAKIVATPDLLKWHPTARFIPNPVSAVDREYDYGLGRTPVVVHLATNPKLKGTALIEKAVEELKAEGLRFEYRFVQGLSQAEAQKIIRESHVVIDQVVDEKETGIPGLMGLVTFEGMAVGRPVICHVDPQYLKFYPECPVVNVLVDKKDLKTKLRYLIDNQEEAQRLGRLGYEYVRKHHNVDIIAAKVDEVYREVLAKHRKISCPVVSATGRVISALELAEVKATRR